MDSRRAESFSDGVFAVAITVLVFNLLAVADRTAPPVRLTVSGPHGLGEYWSGAHGQASVAAVTYGLVMIAISVGYAAVWIYLAAHQEQLGATRRVHRPRLSTFRFTVGNAGYVAGTLIAFASPVAALTIFGLLAVYYMVEHLPSVPMPVPGTKDPNL